MENKPSLCQFIKMENLLCISLSLLKKFFKNEVRQVFDPQAGVDQRQRGGKLFELGQFESMKK